MPNLQRGLPCRNFAYYSMQLCDPGDPKGGAMAQCPPPKYAPDHSIHELFWPNIAALFFIVLVFNLFLTFI